MSTAPALEPTPRAFSVKRGLFTLHLWLGLASGLFFTIAAGSGFFLLLQPQLEARLREYSLSAADPTRLMTADDLMARAVQVTVFDRIDIPARAGAPWKLRAGDGNVFIDPSTGASMGPLLRNSYDWVERLHRRLFMKTEWGRPFLGIATIGYLIILFSGLAMWLEKYLRQPKRGLTMKISVSWKRKIYDAHLVLGVYAVLPLMLMAITGLWWSYREPYKAALYRLIDGAAPATSEAKSKGARAKDRPFVTTLPYSAMLATVQRELPYQGSVRITMPREGSETVTVYKIHIADPLTLPTRDELKLDIGTGQVVERKLYADKTRAEKLMSLMFDIHSGALLGNLTLLIWLLATLVGTTLPITGAVMWWNGMRVQRKARQILKSRSQAKGTPERGSAQ